MVSEKFTGTWRMAKKKLKSWQENEEKKIQTYMFSFLHFLILTKHKNISTVPSKWKAWNSQINMKKAHVYMYAVLGIHCDKNKAMLSTIAYFMSGTLPTSMNICWGFSYWFE